MGINPRFCFQPTTFHPISAGAALRQHRLFLLLVAEMRKRKTVGLVGLFSVSRLLGRCPFYGPGARLYPSPLALRRLMGAVVGATGT